MLVLPADRGIWCCLFMSSLDDSADRFKKSLKRSQAGPEVKRKAIGATENLGEGKKATSLGAALSTEDKI